MQLDTPICYCTPWLYPCSPVQHLSTEESNGAEVSFSLCSRILAEWVLECRENLSEFSTCLCRQAVHMGKSTRGVLECIGMGQTWTIPALSLNHWAGVSAFVRIVHKCFWSRVFCRETRVSLTTKSRQCCISLCTFYKWRKAVTKVMNIPMLNSSCATASS